MARYGTEENVTLWWVPTIEDIEAPTVAEIGAGTDVTCWVAEFNPNVSQNAMDQSTICSKIDSEGAGTVGYGLTVEYYRDNDTDTAWDLFSLGLAGYLVWREGVEYSATATAADPVSVWQVESGEKQIAPTARNTRRTFTVQYFTQDAAIDAEVAGA